MPDPYELDDEGRPVTEDRSEEESAAEADPKPDLIAGTEPVADPAPAPDPSAEEAAMRRQIETTLRFMRIQTVVGIIIILGLIAFVPSIRGLLILVEIIFVFSSLGAYWWLRRNLNARLGGPVGGRRQS
ncbi:MAG: hypothetical protein JST59_13610 [Actinobacteria bacterium]|nr:hypothetical protein [Actinomycetota bacterium]